MRLLPEILAAPLAAVALSCAPARPQQQADDAYAPAIAQPSYPEGRGPTVCLDEAHANFHTLDGRFRAFAELLRRDGYRMRASRAKFDEPAALPSCDIVVIANAQLPESAGSWDEWPYPTPSAFSAAEIAAVGNWVRTGGRLLLIADHMPLAGAAAALAEAFGFAFSDGFALEAFTTDAARAAALAKPTLFRLADRTLRPHAITQGRGPVDAVETVRSFTGQAFLAPADAQPLLVLPENFVSLLPRRVWQFAADTPQVPAGGWLQGAVLRVESGRAAFFGEAAMFTAQTSGSERRPLGMNAPGAEQNYRFVLNLLRWLAAPE